MHSCEADHYGDRYNGDNDHDDHAGYDDADDDNNGDGGNSVDLVETQLWSRPRWWSIQWW